MRTIELPSDAVLILLARALPDAPRIDLNVNTEWWQAAGKDHRKALFVAAVEALGELGARVIPEEFSAESGRPLEGKVGAEFRAERRLLEATIAVRRAIDAECDPVTGTIDSTDPEYARKTALFDALHAEEATAWAELKALRP